MLLFTRIPWEVEAHPTTRKRGQSEDVAESHAARWLLWAGAAGRPCADDDGAAVVGRVLGGRVRVVHRAVLAGADAGAAGWPAGIDARQGTMLARLAADITLVLHLAFIAFVALGALLALRWRWIPFVQLPAAAWGAFIEVTGGACPLTRLENFFRRAAGQGGYPESFVERYLLPVIYPSGLTRHVQFVLAASVIGVNLAAYGVLLWRRANHATRTR
jgi:hypothetical protein